MKLKLLLIGLTTSLIAAFVGSLVHINADVSGLPQAFIIYASVILAVVTVLMAAVYTLFARHIRTISHYLQEQSSELSGEKIPLDRKVEPFGTRKDEIDSLVGHLEETLQLAVSRQQKALVELNAVRTSEKKLMLDYAELDKIVRDLRSAEKTSKYYLSSLSQRIRNPLNTILGLNDVLRDGEYDAEKLKHIDAMEDAGEALRDIVDDVLDLAQLNAGQIELNSGLTEVRPCFAEVIATCRRSAREREVDLYALVDEAVPEYVYIDEKRLRQVFSKLLNHAIQRSNLGDVTVKISTDERKKTAGTTNLICSVQDSAEGLSQEEMTYLFEPKFMYSHNADDMDSGLGLVIARGLARRMNGDVWVEHSDTDGTIMSFSTQALLLGETKSRTVDKDGYEDPKIPANLRILVVDDEAPTRMVNQSLLKTLGIKVETARDGEEAVRKSSERNYDMIFMDIRMPEMNGVEAAKLILATSKQKPIIVAVTANAMDEDQTRYLNVGFRAVISKPVTQQNFGNILRRFSSELGAPPKRKAS